jgi:hypothetical protein
MRYRALRSLHYVDVDGQARTVVEGDYVTKAPEGTIEAALRDGFIKAARSDPKTEEEG